MSPVSRAALLLALAAAAGACGGGTSPGAPDAPPLADAPTDTPPSFAACAKFDAPGNPVPAHVAGALAGADLTAPAQCATIDAAFGVESAGPDAVVHLTGLVAGKPYVVHLTSAADLGFYVVTGCASATGPTSGQCLLFEDNSSGHTEVGRFVAPAAEIYVVVDYYESTAPHDGTFILDAYAEECRDDETTSACGGATPACLEGQCVACASSFDCPSADLPVCDTTAHACIASTNGCSSDDAREPADDGPAGAALLALDAGGYASLTGSICAAPKGESDYVAFTVDSLGQTWDFQLAWMGDRNLDLELFSATGEQLGLSYWDHPETVRLTYLPVGTYYARVSEFSSATDPVPVAYTLTATRALGAGCTSAADCAAESRNQLFRGACTAGACADIDGEHAVPAGGACDSQSDCASGLACPSFFFVTNADTRETCEPSCAGDSDCAALGDDYLCTTYLAENECVQKCTADAQCPTVIDAQPSSGPWSRLSCNVASGRCLP